MSDLLYIFVNLCYNSYVDKNNSKKENKMLPKIAQNLQSLLNKKHPSTILSIPNRFSVEFRPSEQMGNRPPTEAFIQVCDLETGTQFHFTETFILKFDGDMGKIYSSIEIGKPVTRRLNKFEKALGIIEPRNPNNKSF